MISDQQHLVSVIIPTFNRADLIGSCVQSALSQAYKNIEVIVVDDGSVDGTESVVQSIPDTRLQYVKVENGGAPRARNLGAKRASGRYLKFLDSDDHLEENAVLKQMSVQRSRSDLGTHILCGSCRIIDIGGREIATWPFQKGQEGRLLSDGELILSNPPTTSPLYPAEVFRIIGGFREDLPVWQDYEIIIRARSIGYKFLFHPTLVYYMRQHSLDQRVSASNSGRKAAAQISLLKYTLEVVEQLDGDSEAARRALAIRAAMLARRLVLARDGEMGRNATLFSRTNKLPRPLTALKFDLLRLLRL